MRRLLAVTLACLSIVASGPAVSAQPSSTGAVLDSAALEPATAPRHGYFRWPTAGRLTQKYGCTGFRMNRARGRCAFFHNGIDIANKRGTPVLAAAPGVVRYVGWDPYDRSRDRAWVVIVRHAGGLKSWYAHLLPRRVRNAKVGDRVRRGQLVGYMGKTGKATGVHLHFMAQLGGSFVNPQRFLPRNALRPPRHIRALRASAHQSGFGTRAI